MLIMSIDYPIAQTVALVGFLGLATSIETGISGITAGDHGDASSSPGGDRQCRILL